MPEQPDTGTAIREVLGQNVPLTVGQPVGVNENGLITGVNGVGGPTYVPTVGVFIGRDPGHPAPIQGSIVYTREVDGRHRLYLRHGNGEEIELTHLASPIAIPAPEDIKPSEPEEPRPTLWDHLTGDD